MLKIKHKFPGILVLLLIAFAGSGQVAQGQGFNLLAGPTIDIQSVTSDWSAGTNATYMTRWDPNNVPIVIRGTTPIVSANQLDFDYNLGYEAFIAKSFEGGGKIEFKFSNLEDVSATYSSTIMSTDFLATNPPTLAGGPPSFPQTTTLNSEIMSGELSLYIPLGLSTDWSVGFRWVEYEETLLHSWPSQAIFHTTNVSNHLYGFQTGLDTLLTSTDLYEVSIFGKGGVYGNDADQVTTTEQPAVISRNFDTKISAVVEAGVKSKLRITDNISFDFGYTGLYFSGIALAPDQLNTHTQFPPVGSFTSTRLDSSSAFFHGGFAGLTINN